MIAVAEGCTLDGRLARLERRTEDDDVILEMVGPSVRPTFFAIAHTQVAHGLGVRPRRRSVTGLILPLLQRCCSSLVLASVKAATAWRLAWNARRVAGGAWRSSGVRSARRSPNLWKITDSRARRVQQI
jgi:hypothetical protein